MPSTYSSLKFELIATGEQPGTWGNTTNVNIGTAIEEAITGSATVTFTSGANTAIALTNTNAAQAARNLRLDLSGTMTTSQYLYVPAIEKFYIINNTLSNTVIVSNGSNAAATGTAVSIPSSTSVMLFNDGVNVTSVISHIPSLANVTITSGNVTVTNLTATTGNITTGNISTLTVTSNASIAGASITSGNATLTNLTATTGNITNANISSLTVTGNVTVSNVTVNSGNATFTNMTATRGNITTANISSLTVTSNATIAGASVTSGNATLTNLTATTGNVTTGNIASLTVTSNASIAGASITSGNATFTNVTATRGNVTTGNIASLTVTSNATIAGASVTSGNATLTNLTATTANLTNANVTSVLTVAAGTNAAPSITFSGDTNTGIYSPAADTIAFTEGGVESMRIDSSGNLGLGVTPSAWNANVRAFEIIESWASISSNAGNGAGNFANNAFFNTSGSWVYKNTAAASRYQQLSGVHAWFNAASGTAGNAITFTQAMTLDASGNLGVGTSSPNALLDAYTTQGGSRIAATHGTGGSYPKVSGISFGATSTSISPSNNGGTTTFVGGAGIYANNTAASNNPTDLVFWTTSGGVSAERARITSGGLVGIGIQSPGGTLDVNTSDNTINSILSRHSGASAGNLQANSSNASLAGNVIESGAVRSANAAYKLFAGYSGNFGDLEFGLYGDGNGKCDGSWTGGGADYAEFFESATGAALTLGATVVLDGNKVREATDQDPVAAIMGVVRPKEPGKATAVIANAAWNKWANKYLTDDFDRYIMEDHDVFEWTDEEGNLKTYESHNIPAGVTVPDDAVVKTHDDKGNKFQHYKLNPAWNPDAEYVNRENRPEWIIVGLVGQVKVLKGQPVNDRWIKMRDVSETVEEWMIR